MVTVTAVVKATGTNEAGECSAIHPRKLLSIMEWPRNQTYRDVATILP
ncbi:hypothetical protein GBAR_LOCUS27560 [Geodia barretti]|uniref:Uncharacterized protein n=1 Tax=Geodia barretti TaxID=519541 RepID=A0AA35TM19_GEOBA|nr:hypothetical protein GBAR_LOCUS27560 [Geodia barretti]